LKAPAQPPPGLPVIRESVDSGMTTAAHAALDGRRRGLFAVLPFAGPAFVAKGRKNKK